jgi:phosphatidylethanolamine/phosphatidyl-N-methylethanolamine N-methyltransferase
MQVGEIKKIYGRYARVYDAIFKRWFYPRQKHAIQALDISPGQRVLDVGVGTGFSLPLYPQHADVIGVDLLSEMICEAQEKVYREQLRHVTLMQMDAERLAFADDVFDYVVAAFVVSVVPDPVRFLSEVKRVSKPDGQIIIINHFQSENPIMAQLEKWAAPLCTKIGWHSDLRLADLIRHTDLQIERRYSLNRIDLWDVVLASNKK